MAGKNALYFDNISEPVLLFNFYLRKEVESILFIWVSVRLLE